MGKDSDSLDKSLAMRVRTSTKDMYRYVVVLSVKNLEALEELFLHVQDDGCLMLDLKERMAYKRLAKEESAR